MSVENETEIGTAGAMTALDGVFAPVEAVEIAEAEVPPPATEPVAAVPENKKKWYIVKVQSGREDTIRNALIRRVKIDSLEEYVGRILVPVEKIMEVRNGKRVTKRRKKFPGYVMCEVEFNDRVLYLFRETSGVGDFVGGTGTGFQRIPSPMPDREVEAMLRDQDDTNVKADPTAVGAVAGEPKKKAKIEISYAVGDRVKVREGTFKDMDGEVREIGEPGELGENPKVKVVLTIWGRPVDVEVEYWQVDPI